MNTKRQARGTGLLQEATELSQLFQSIEGAFAAGELQKIADMLATMRRSLKLVGNVPEFSGGTERLQARGLPTILQFQTHVITLRLFRKRIPVRFSLLPVYPGNIIQLD